MLLTEQEIRDIARSVKDIGENSDRALIQAAQKAVIAKIKAQEPVAWLHEQRTDSDVVTDAVKSVWGKVAVGRLAAYSIPLYKLPEGEGDAKS